MARSVVCWKTVDGMRLAPRQLLVISDGAPDLIRAVEEAFPRSLRQRRNREVGPDTTVRLLAEVERNAAGAVYLWVQSLEIVN